MSLGFTLTRLFETDGTSFGLPGSELDAIAAMFDAFFPGAEGERRAMEVFSASARSKLN